MCMKGRWIWIALLCPLSLWGQEQKGDSLRYTPEFQTDVGHTPMQALPVRTDAVLPSLPQPDTARIELRLPLTDTNPVRPYAINPSPLYLGDYATQSYLLRYRQGAWMGMGEQTTLPGIGRINEATLLWSQQWSDRLSMQAYLSATQLEMEFLHRHVWGVGGALQYQLDDHWTLKAFGSYDTGNPYQPYGRQYGGSLVWQASSRWGLEGGVRRRYNAFTHRWETEPIVAPYYQIDKLRLQIDMGPVLHQLIREIFIGSPRRSGPTIAPPTRRK